MTVDHRESALCLDAEWVRAEVWENDDYEAIRDRIDALPNEVIVQAIEEHLDMTRAGDNVDEAIFNLRVDVIDDLAGRTEPEASATG